MSQPVATHSQIKDTALPSAAGLQPRTSYSGQLPGFCPWLLVLNNNQAQIRQHVGDLPSAGPQSVAWLAGQPEEEGPQRDPRLGCLHSSVHSLEKKDISEDSSELGSLI